MRISHQFDAGNIQVLTQESAQNIKLAILPDSNADYYQWFYYRVQLEALTPLTMRITNAANASYPAGWDGYQAVASYDRQHWFRVPTRYTDGEIVIEHTPEHESVYYAYFTPYPLERHYDLLARAQMSPLVQIESLGRTVDGRGLDMLRIASAAESDRLNIWITARQHPGESMAEWLAEGLIERLIDPHDPTSKAIIERCNVYIVPNMNPDGSFRGNLRANAAGANLNREWANPSKQSSPEVYWVREQMLATGVDLFLDIHGDEALPYNFLVGCEGVPSYNDSWKRLEHQFKSYLLSANPDFQTEHGYPKNAPGTANLALATNWVGEQFKCLAFTLEMPFKDNLNRPDPQHGWSAERAKRLGHDLLSAIYRFTDNQ